MRCEAWRCKEEAIYECVKKSGGFYSIPFGYCEKHKDVIKQLPSSKLVELKKEV